MRPTCETARSCTSACGNAASCRLSGCYPSLHALTVIRQHSRTTFSLHLCTPKPGTSFSTARATQAEVSTSNSGALPNAVGALPEQHHHSSCPRDTNRTLARPDPTRPARPFRRTARPAETEAPGRAVSGGRRERGWGRFEPLAARPGRLHAGLSPPRGSGSRRPGPASARPPQSAA